MKAILSTVVRWFWIGFYIFAALSVVAVFTICGMAI